MENYQMFFPCSSSMGQPSGFPMASNMGAASSNMGFNGLQGESLNGFLNLRTENQVRLVREEEEVEKHHSQSGSITTSADHGAENGQARMLAGRKKGEKKIRKPRYAFQTRSQVDILDDGYRWRKYGQKAVKNNKFPRSYYRCTYQGCNVKKQVQRLTRDDGIIVTTYEGMHSHPIDKPTDNFEHILNQMQIYTPF
ncbi:probable WRKY transcription factor 75 [Ziziphus jujuba]|uniref:WRKY domain-containing protein n=2 Tax=Ziziphus jujuba TaxID=326968 RepID=A0A978UVM0_ZIZJJ|nr:probable WRKY transcription factor 75 [Ziziphus jujuba]KAH7518920.1 hypothetical protein FEM48_Zijuj09G0222300 [Ziziphus jujuba var. spinosa]